MTLPSNIVQEIDRAGAAPVPGFALFRDGFRPLFLACGAYAVLAMALWIAVLAGHLEMPSLFDPLTWHQHEMLFGFVVAAIGGFLMAAVPHWTGRPPVSGVWLHLLVWAWLAGRLGVAFSQTIGMWPAAILDMAYLVLLAAVVLRELMAVGNRRNVKITVLLCVLAVCNGFVHADHGGATAMILALFIVAVLVAVIGGRITPTFTRNWLSQRDARAKVPASLPLLDALAIASLALAGVVYAFLPDHLAAGIALLAAALLHGARLFLWRGLAVRTEPLLWVLHLGYAWLVAGLALLGISVLFEAVEAGMALHALGAGAIGTMILAVMTRASLGHTGRPLAASRTTTAAYVLVSVSALVRMAAPALGDSATGAYTVAGLAWMAAFGLFLVVYAPILWRPRLPDFC